MSDSWYEEVEKAYQLFDVLLASELPYYISHSEPITRWKVLEAFLYGKFAHVNPTHRETLNQTQVSQEPISSQKTTHVKSQ